MLRLISYGFIRVWELGFSTHAMTWFGLPKLLVIIRVYLNVTGSYCSKNMSKTYHCCIEVLVLSIGAEHKWLTTEHPLSKRPVEKFWYYFDIQLQCRCGLYCIEAQKLPNTKWNNHAFLESNFNMQLIIIKKKDESF